MKNGFTLIEIIIVISIIAVLGGTGMASYSRLTNQKKLDSETSKLLDVLQLTKQKALSVDNKELCPATKPYVGGYQLRVVSNMYELFVACTVEANDISAPDYLITGIKYSVEPGITMSSSTIMYRVFSLGTTTSIIRITSPALNRSKCISINNIGTVTVTDKAGAAVCP